MSVGCMARRAADALLRELGKDEVALQVPMTTAAGSKTGLGLNAAAMATIPFRPVLVRYDTNAPKSAEIVASDEAMERAVAMSGAQDANSLLTSMTAVVVNGRTMRAVKIRPDSFAGYTYLWTIEARE